MSNIEQLNKMEQLVSLEQAKWLHDLGFSEECFVSYDNNSIPAPTINQALDWLADVKGVQISISYSTIKGGCYRSSIFDGSLIVVDFQKTRKEASKELLQLIYTNKEKLGL